MSRTIVYLIPSFLNEGAVETIPLYVPDAVKKCEVFFVENERSARRYLKSIWREMVIDEYLWVTIHKAEPGVKNKFLQFIKEGKHVGIISEAGCPGIADPGQILISAAHEAGAIVKPLVGPSSILLALMASGMDGQHFQFIGYLPIDRAQRAKAIRDLETESARKNCTQIFIETPYRNNQLMEGLLKNCKPATRICIAADLTGDQELIQTKSTGDWKKNIPDLHKRPAVFLLLAAD
jgi:16S rRNA (cytidine1402-2'-O)-methyltransferase